MFSSLSQIAKHSVDLAEMVVEAEIFPAVLTCLKGKLLTQIENYNLARYFFKIQYRFIHHFL